MAFRNWYRALAASLRKTNIWRDSVYNITGKKKKRSLSILSAHTKIISSSPRCFYVWTMTANLFWSKSTRLWKKEWWSLHQQVTLSQPSSEQPGLQPPLWGCLCPKCSLRRNSSFLPLLSPVYQLFTEGLPKVCNDPISWEHVSPCRGAQRWLWNDQGYHLVVKPYFDIPEETVPSTNLFFPWIYWS